MGRRYVTLKEKADRLEDKKNKIREQLANPLLSPEKKKILKKELKGLKKKKKGSVWTVSGGLPSLGKRR